MAIGELPYEPQDSDLSLRERPSRPAGPGPGQSVSTPDLPHPAGRDAKTAGYLDLRKALADQVCDLSHALMPFPSLSLHGHRHVVRSETRSDVRLWELGLQTVLRAGGGPGADLRLTSS